MLRRHCLTLLLLLLTMLSMAQRRDIHILAVNDMHAHVRRSVLNMPEADGSACLVGAGMGREHLTKQALAAIEVTVSGRVMYRSARQLLKA